MVKLGYNFLSFLALSSIAVAAPAHKKQRHQQQQQCQGQAATATPPKAIYLLSNDPTANAVMALTVDVDGTLAMGSMTETGGAGSAGIDSSTNASAGPDALFSQSPLKVAGNMLAAVNPGSNTMSLFSIDAADPTKLTMLGQPVDTMGEFPVSVDMSTKLSQACVANGGAVSGISCFSISQNGAAPLDQALRAFNGFAAATPPVGPLGTVSHTFFNADSTALLATVKGDPTKDNTGFLAMFPVTNNAVAATGTQVSPPGTAVLFGSANIPGTYNIIATDASVGAAVIAVDAAAGSANTLSITNVTDQSATCWSTISPATNTAFVTDVGVNHMVEIDLSNGQIVQDLFFNNTNPGLIDLAASGNFIFALSPGSAGTAGMAAVAPAIQVVDVSGGSGNAKAVQNFALQGVNAGQAVGMTVLD